MSSKKTFFQKIEGIPFSIWAVSLAIGLMAVSVSMTFSISPFFMTTVLGFSMFSLGSIEGFCEGIAQVSKLFSGVSGDYFRRKKPTLLVGFSLAILSKPLFILAGGSGSVIVSKCMERISNGVMATPRDAFVADTAPPNQKGSCFGLMMSFKTGGCVVGSLLIGYLLTFTHNYLLLLWIGFIAAVLSMLVIIFFMKEKTQEEIVTHQKKTKPTRLSWKDLKSLSWAYWSLIIVASVYMCARFSDGFLILRMKELGASVALSASIIGIFNFVSALCCFPIGRLSDKINRDVVVYFSILTLVLCNVCFIFASSVTIGMLGVIFWGAQRATSQILFCAIIADVAPTRIMGTAMGIFYLLTGIIAWGAGSVAGWIAEMSLQHAFTFGLIMSGLSLVLHFIRSRTLKSTLPLPAVTEDLSELSQEAA